MKKQKKTKKSYHHISIKERMMIEVCLYLDLSIRKISKFLKRSVSSVSEEIKRNSVNKKYTAFKADRKSKNRRILKRKYQSLKIVENEKLWRYIVDKLKLDWSPETIAGRLKRIEVKKNRANKDTIYKFIFSIYGRRYVKYLRYKGKKRKNKGEDKRKGKLKDRVSIDERPEIVNIRARFGDWEADFIVSKKSSCVLLVLVERKSRFALLKKLKDRNNDRVNKAIKNMLDGFCVLSLTLDNDIAFKKHKELKKMIKTDIFFCHSYSSYEKGSVENVNQILRRYIKKGSDINEYSDKFIKELENKINNRPRKILNFQTPLEVLIENANLKNKKKLIKESNKYLKSVRRNKKTSLISLMFDV